MSVRITGTLARNAECRITSDAPQRAYLTLRLRGEEHNDIPIEAVYRVPGDGFACLHAASRATDYLVKGARVTIYAAAIEPGINEPLRLRGVDCVRADAIDERLRHHLERIEA